MRPFSLLSVVALATAVAVIAGSGTPAHAQKKPGLTTVPLVVTLQPTDSAGTAMQTTGDAGPDLPSEYVHGVDEVYAIINGTGGLTIDFQPAAASPRAVYFDYAIGTGTAPPSGTMVYSGVRTHLTSANTPLQSMPVGSTQCIAFGTSFTYADGTNYRNSYQATNIGSVDTSATAFGQVTRLDANTWLLESREGLCNTAARAHVAKLIKGTTVRNKTTYSDQGAFVMGLSLRLARK